MEPSIVRGTPPPCPERFNLAAYVLSAGRVVPEKEALRLVGAGRESWSYARLIETVERVAGGLAAAGLERGDRLVLRLGNEVDLPLLFLGANALGAVPVPVSAQLTAAELGPMTALLGPKMVALGEGSDLPPVEVPVLTDLAALRRAAPAGFADTAKDDPAYIVFTSGSGGRAKAVVHAQRAVWARRMMWDGWYGLTADDVLFHAGAFNWTYTLGTGLMDPWAAGATALIRQDGALPEIISAERPTIFAAVPGVYRQMLRWDGDLRAACASLRHGLSAGESLQASLRAAWRDRTGLELHEALGMTEVSTYVSSSPDRPAPDGITGWPQPGRSVAVLGENGPAARGEAGELAVHASDPGLMLGYLGEAPPRDWFRTGDRVEMLEDGAIRYLGRNDDLMTAQGYRVSPLEVEAALEALPEVAEAGVCEVSPKPGTRIIAGFVTGAPNPEGVKAALATRLAAYKCPKHIQVVPDLPRGPTGKLARRALPALYDPELP